MYTSYFKREADSGGDVGSVVLDRLLAQVSMLICDSFPVAVRSTSTFELTRTTLDTEMECDEDDDLLLEVGEGR